jgi:hypothetical protein
MGVKVRISSPSSQTKSQYEDVGVDHANYFSVSNGMLHLYTSDAGDAQLVNIYNRDAWLGAWLYGDALEK